MARPTTAVLSVVALLCVGGLLFGYLQMLRSESRTRDAALTALAEDARSEIAAALTDMPRSDEATLKARITTIMERSSRAVHPTPNISVTQVGGEWRCTLWTSGNHSILIKKDGSIEKSQ